MYSTVQHALAQAGASRPTPKDWGVPFPAFFPATLQPSAGVWPAPCHQTTLTALRRQQTWLRTLPTCLSESQDVLNLRSTSATILWPCRAHDTSYPAVTSPLRLRSC